MYRQHVRSRDSRTIHQQAKRTGTRTIGLLTSTDCLPLEVPADRQPSLLWSLEPSHPPSQKLILQSSFSSSYDAKDPPPFSSSSSLSHTNMQLFRTLTASLLVAIAALSSTMETVDGFHFFGNETESTTTSNSVMETESEPLDVAVTNFHVAVVATALSDKRNFGPLVGKPICVHDVTRVRESVAKRTRDLYIEVKGCAMNKPQALCSVPVKCTVVPFEVHVVGPEKTPGFDAVAELVTKVAKGKPVKTPFVVQTIGILL